ncbi:MAG: GtrA family protein, partial [Xanthobacteraceae bacterium]
MRFSNVERCAAGVAVPMHAAAVDDPVRRFFEVLPRPLRFLGVGGLGLITDLAIFTLVIAHGLNPLGARLISLTFATLVTWRLNRALTFDRSGRRTADEAMRYAAVATATQAMSYGIFAVLVVTLLAPIPQLAVIGGAAAGAVVSDFGQAVFAIRPR